MDFQQLRHILAVADTKSYTKAADCCGTSRQNIAHSIKVLECELDTTLFERKGGKMTSTAVGRRIITKANDIITKVDGIYALCLAPQEGEAKLTVALSTNILAGMTMQTDVFFLHQSSKVQFVEMDIEACYQSVLSGASDLAIVMCMSRMFLGCATKDLRTSKAFGLVSASSPLAKKEFLKLDDLHSQDIVVMSKPEAQYAPMILDMELLGYSTDDIRIITSTSTVIRLIRSRGVMGIVSDSFAQNPPSDMRAIPFKDSRYNWHFYAFYKTDSPRIQNVTELVEGAQEAFLSDH